MTQLKEIGDYSIESIHSITESGGNVWAWLIAVVGLILFVASILISNYNCGVLGTIMFLCGFVGAYITNTKVPAFCICLKDKSDKYHSIDSCHIGVTKDVDEMTKRVQKEVDRLTNIANEMIAKSKEKERIEFCMMSIEEQVKGMIK